jgi:hypothetical protein
LGVCMGVVMAFLQGQIYDPQWPHFDVYSWYVWPSIVLCALLGRRPLTTAETERLGSMLSRRIGERS